MTITNREIAAEYERARDGNPKRLQPVAMATDAAMEAMLEVFKQHGVAFPNDDRCMNIELAIFQTAAETVMEN